MLFVMLLDLQLLLLLYLVVEMGTVKSFLIKVTNNVDKIVYGKKYDFIAKDKGEYFQIYRRWYEGKPWKRYCKIPKNSINDTKNWEYEEGGQDVLGTKYVI